jgi:hypothetical protein
MDIEVVHGQNYDVITTIVSGSNQAAMPINSFNFGPRLADFSDLFRLYRCVKLELEFCRGRDSGNVDAYGFMGAVMGGTVTAPTTLALTAQFEHFAIAHPGMTTKVVLSLKRSHLLGLVPWWQTESTGDPELDTQGHIFVGVHNQLSTSAALAGTLTLVQRFTFEFSQRLPVEATLARRAARGALVVQPRPSPACPAQSLPRSVHVTDEEGRELDPSSWQVVRR